jgi:hypothetical protein
LAYAVLVLVYLAISTLHAFEHFRADARDYGRRGSRVGAAELAHGAVAPVRPDGDVDCETCRTLAYAGVAVLQLAVVGVAIARRFGVATARIRPARSRRPVWRAAGGLSARGPPVAV